MDRELFISAIHKPGLLVGQIVRSAIPRGTISSISLPSVRDGFFILSAKDITGSNGIKVFSQSLPLLASERIRYRSEPILAVFGPDEESVAQLVSQIHIHYEPDAPTIDQPDEVIKERRVHWGSEDSFFSGVHQLIQYTYGTGSQHSELGAPVGALSYLESEELIIHAATSWPLHLRASVSECCGIPKRRIRIIQHAYRPTIGEHLLIPSVLASLCTIATLKSGKPARILDTEPVHKPEMLITRMTALDQQKLPMAERVEVQINQGAFGFFSSELIEHVIAGSTPSYSLKAFDLVIRTIRTASTPRWYFHGFAFSDALFSTQAHYSALSTAAGINPISYRLKTTVENPLRPASFLSIRARSTKRLLEKTAGASDFYRKHAVYEMQRRRNRQISTFTDYTRGIGIASGRGINGFSSRSSFEHGYTVIVTLDVNDQVRIQTSMIGAKAIDIWRLTAGELLSVNPEHVVVIESEGTEPVNSGPDILHRDMTIITTLITRCCESIKNQRFKEPLPISVKRSFKKSVKKNRPRAIFPYSCNAATALELEVDAVSLCPVVHGVWVSIECGHIPQQYRKTLLGELNTAILNTLRGITSIEDPSKLAYPCRIETFESPGSFVHPLPAIRALVSAAYTAALSQALDTPVTTVPAGAELICNHTGGEA